MSLRTVVAAALLSVLAITSAGCPKEEPAKPSSWTVRVVAGGAPVASTPIKVTFLQKMVCAVPPCPAQPVGTIEGSTDANGSVTMPVLITSFGKAGGRADRALVAVPGHTQLEVVFGVDVVDVGGSAAPEAANADALLAEAPTSTPTPSLTPWKVKLTSKGAPLANAKVNVSLFQRVQCVAAPCDPQQVGNASATTDADGVATIAVNPAFIGKPDVAKITVDGHATVSAAVGAATVDIP